MLYFLEKVKSFFTMQAIVFIQYFKKEIIFRENYPLFRCFGAYSFTRCRIASVFLKEEHKMTDSPPIVWIVQDNGKHNYVKAAAFGQLRTLMPARMQLQLNCDEAVSHIKDQLLNFDDCDSILATGDPAAIAIAVAAAAVANNGLVNMLKYDRQADTYYKLPMDISDILFENNNSEDCYE